MNNPPPGEKCPYCRNLAKSRRRRGMYWLYECDCGGVGVSERPLDLDDAADSLINHLEFLPIPPPALAPPEPAGASGLLYARYYDNDTLVERLRPFFLSGGYELRLVKTTAGANEGFKAWFEAEIAAAPADEETKRWMLESYDRAAGGELWFLWARPAAGARAATVMAAPGGPASACRGKG